MANDRDKWRGRWYLVRDATKDGHTVLVARKPAPRDGDLWQTPGYKAQWGPRDTNRPLKLKPGEGPVRVEVTIRRIPTGK